MPVDSLTHPVLLYEQLTGGWVKPHGDFPISVVEAQGGMIGNDLCVVSGFLNGADDSTPNIYCIDTQDTTADWVQRVSLKDADSIEGTKLGIGLSHGAEAVVGSKFYVCGGVSHHLSVEFMEPLKTHLLTFLPS